jgi:hypothetical protein
MTKKTLVMMVFVIALLGLFTSKAYAMNASGAGFLKPHPREARVETAIGKADEEIDRRVAAINTIIARINAMQKLSEGQKAGLVAQANQLLADLGTQKNKIDADTDPEVLKTDRKAINNSYRVYMLFMPRMNILAAADRIIEIADQALGLGPQIQTKITQLANSGKDVSGLNTALTDLQSKLADAKTQAQNAINTVSSLVLDQGNATTMQANNTAIKNARAMIKTAVNDVNAGRNDLKTIRQSIKGLTVKPTVTPSP